MKKVILLAMFMPLMAYGQIIENFEPGNANNWLQSTDVRWKADATSALSGNYSLHHVFDNPDAGTDRIGLLVKNLHPSEGLTRWSFLIRYGYDPSSLNNWSVFLMSDTGPESFSPDGNTNGFAIGVNLTGSDDTLRLWKIEGTRLTAVINCGLNWQTDIGMVNGSRIIVERTQTGVWSVSVFKPGESSAIVTSGTDNKLFGSGWFGVYYKYSSTRDRLLWLDDIIIEGIFYEDNVAPLITRCVPVGKYATEITFNEEPAPETIVPENFSLNSKDRKAISVILKSSMTFRILFNDMLVNKSLNKLFISSICDKNGNCVRDIQSEFTPLWAETGDVVISEIMADPAPEVSLPGKEYIEISNRTEYPFSLEKWQVSTDEQHYLLPESTLEPSGMVIICAMQDTSLFAKYGRVTGMKQFPSLTDGGRILYLSDSSGVFIHGVEYSTSWYRDELKSGGGWSLEMVDTRYPFSVGDNWTASESKKGGTPGSVNSVAENNPDLSFYGISNVFADDSVTLTVRFSEPVISLLQKTGDIKLEGNEIKELYLSDPLFREYKMILAGPLGTGTVYDLEISEGVTDFAGNRMQNPDYRFGLSQPAQPGDLLFNELLFNPLPGDPDYIEFYNCSGKIIDASRLQVVSVSDVTGDNSEAVMVSGDKRCILPDSYYSISTDIKKVSERYISADPDNLYEIGSLPSMPDDKGHLILFNRELEKLDEVVYSEKTHFSLLSTFEGIALEKILPQKSSGESTNWHSASESSGWGTPGAKNSVFVESPESEDKITFSTTKITPDNDGIEDFLTIACNMVTNTNVISVSVFDETGNFVKKIASNLYAGAEASIVWDGTADDGSPVHTGIYIILVTVYDSTGKTNKWKKVCTVIRT